MVHASLALEEGATAPSSALPMIGVESMVMGLVLKTHKEATMNVLSHTYNKMLNRIYLTCKPI